MPADPRHGVRSPWSNADPSPNATIRAMRAADPARVMIVDGVDRATPAIRAAIGAARMVGLG